MLALLCKTISIVTPTQENDMPGPISDHIGHVMAVAGSLFQFMTQSTWARLDGTRAVSDFVVGNPHEMPLPAFVEALQRQTTPLTQDWYAYTMSKPAAVATVAATLRASHG